MNTIRINVPRPFAHTQQRKFVDYFQIASKLLVYLSALLYYLRVMYVLYLILRFIPEKYYPKLFYPIEQQIISASTRVIFTRSKHNNQEICLKLWQLYDQKICNEKLVTRNVDYLLEGFEFNRRFALDVYLGIAPITLSNNKRSVLRGRLIEKPEKSNLKPGVEYALMMRCLEEKYRLDSQVKHKRLDIGTNAGMEFLAREIALMHIQLDNSPSDMGTSDRISSKLKINIELFF